MTSTRRTVLAASLAALAASLTAGCGVWRFGSNNKIFNGILESGTTVTNTSVGISYTIPNGYYQNKYEATIIPLITLRQGRDPHGAAIIIQRATGPHSRPTDPGGENAELEALWWTGYSREESTSHIRRDHWSGPHVPGVEVSFSPIPGDTRQGCAVAVVGSAGNLILIEALGSGTTLYLPEVHDVAVSVKMLTAPSATPR